MGGRNGLDVVLARPARLPSGTCLLDARLDVTTSARDVLASDDHDSWRRCYRLRTNTVVPCNEPHTGEYIATGSKRRATFSECVAAANIYTDQGFDENKDLLQAVALATIDGEDNGPRCMIAVRGTQSLDASIRGLGVNAVPLMH